MNKRAYINYRLALLDKVLKDLAIELNMSLRTLHRRLDLDNFSEVEKLIVNTFLNLTNDEIENLWK